MDPMKLDSWDRSGVEWVQCPGVGRRGEEYNGLTDIILNFALSCGYNNSMGEPRGSYRSYQSTVLTAPTRPRSQLVLDLKMNFVILRLRSLKW